MPVFTKTVTGAKSLVYTIMAVAMMVTLFLPGSPAAFAQSSPARHTCGDGTFDGSKSGDDHCRLRTEKFYELDGRATPSVDLLRNDGSPAPLCADKFRGFNPEWGYLSVSRSSDEDFPCSFSIWLNRGVQNFSFDYQSDDDNWHTVLVETWDAVIAAAPSVYKAKKKGHFVAENPPRIESGRTLIILYGKRTAPAPDGRLRLAPGESVVSPTKRKNLFWIAFQARDGRIIAEGTVRGISPVTSPAVAGRFSPATLELWNEHRSR